MNAATFKLKVLPKRMAKKSEAASYCGIGLDRFKAQFPFPAVKMPGGDELIDLQDCDRWIDSIKAGGDDNDADAIIEKLGK
jgi:hypothetical protein